MVVGLVFQRQHGLARRQTIVSAEVYRFGQHQGLAEWITTLGVDLKIAHSRRIVLQLAAGVGRADLLDDHSIIVTTGYVADMLAGLGDLPAIQDDVRRRIRLEERGCPYLRISG
jgi:hypothetical protein